MYFINAVSTANQIEQLLALKYVDEAIQLFESLFDNKNSVEHEEVFILNSSFNKLNNLMRIHRLL